MIFCLLYGLYVLQLKKFIKIGRKRRDEILYIYKGTITLLLLENYELNVQV